MNKKAKIIAITNQKGGVGKTTTSINLSACLGRMNHKILIIDADAQGNATTGLGVEKDKIIKSMYEVMIGEESLPKTIIKDVVFNVDLAPATIYLAGAEAFLMELRDPSRTPFKIAIDNIAADYDFIFIDCPPSLGLINRSVLAVADAVLIPLQAEYLALEGLTQLLCSIRDVQKISNPNLSIEGILLTMYDSRTNLSSEVKAEILKYFPEKVYKQNIPRNVKVSEAPSHGQAVIDYEPSSSGALAYHALAKEFLQKSGQER